MKVEGFKNQATFKQASDIRIGTVFSHGTCAVPDFILRTSKGYLNIQLNIHYTDSEYAGVGHEKTCQFANYREYPNARVVLE